MSEPLTSERRASGYWQHERPLDCPRGHQMIWLGGRVWICGRGACNKIYVEQQKPRYRFDGAGWAQVRPT